jgi:flagellar protein FliJ
VSRYQFRLATVLRVRRMEEEAAKVELRAANLALRQAVTARDAAEERYRAFTALGAAVVSAAQLHAERLEAGLLAEQCSVTQRVALERAAGAALAQARWSKSAKRVAVLERLDARRREEHAAAELRAEVALVDDLVTARYAAEHLEADYLGAEGSDVSTWSMPVPERHRHRPAAAHGAGR